MDEWIKRLIDFTTSPMRHLIEAISERISWVYTLITRVLSSVKNATASLFNAVAGFRDWCVWAIGEGYLTAKWIITIRLPAIAGNMRDAAISWASQRITEARNALTGTINDLSRWFGERVAAIFNDLEALKRWAIAQINPIIDLLNRVREIVYNLLTSPQRLASWLVGAMVEEMWAYANRNADRIALWMRAKSVKYTLQAAGQIESIIARLL